MAGRKRAVRAALGEVDAEAVAARARELGVFGWVRPTGEVHAEGLPDAIDAFLEGVELEKARVRTDAVNLALGMHF